MLENEAKGWYGSYSLAGKRSAEKYNNIVHKNEILKGEAKKVKIRDMFTPDEQKQDILEEHTDILKLYSFEENILKKRKLGPKNKSQNNGKHKKESFNFKYFFHNKHCATQNKKEKRLPPEPGCTRYNPNYDFIWPKLLTGPKWCDILGRKQKKREIDNRDFLINNLENYDKYVINNGDIKCFVNMNKSTQRGAFVDNKDLRIKTDRPFSKTSKSKQKKNLAYELTDGAARTYKNGFYRQYNLTENNKTDKNSPKELKNNIINNIPKEYISSNSSARTRNEFKLNFINPDLKYETNKNSGIGEDNYQSSYSESKSYNLFQKKRNMRTFYIDSDLATMGSSEQIKCKIKNPAPDFSKLISREQREKVKAFRKDNVPFIVPNYSYVMERPIVTAIYKKKKKASKNKKIEFLGIDSSLKYNPNSIIEKYNNHFSTKVPKFKYMTSRPNKKGSPLPFYMQQVHDRSATYLVTDKSLKLNHFSEGKYIPASSTFFPKKSFNNIINVGFANSKSFKEIDTDEDIHTKKLQIKQHLKLNHIDYEELANEGALNKFDNFSYKTILKKKKKGNSNKPIMSFEVYEENN